MLLAPGKSKGLVDVHDKCKKKASELEYRLNWRQDSRAPWPVAALPRIYEYLERIQSGGSLLRKLGQWKYPRLISANKSVGPALDERPFRR